MSIIKEKEFRDKVGAKVLSWKQELAALPPWMREDWKEELILRKLASTEVAWEELSKTLNERKNS